MPTNLVIHLTPPVFPEGYCQTGQRLANDIASGMGAFIPGNYTVFNYGDTEPSVEDQDKPWLRLNPDGSMDRWYVFSSGVWASPNPTPPEGGERRMFVGTESEVWSYDGGDGDDPDGDEPSYATGAMWQVDEDFAGRIPIGVGTPEAWGSALTQGTNAGTSKVQLTESILPPHDHKVARSTQQNGSGNLLSADSTLAYVGGGMDQTNYALLGLDATANPANVGKTSSVGEANDTDNRLPILPPVRAVWIIKRTSRIAYVPA